MKKIIIYACHIKSEYQLQIINHNLNIIKPFSNLILIVYSLEEQNKTIDKKLLEWKKNISIISLQKVINKGYDFEKYKIGIKILIKEKKLNSINYVILMNDSFFFIRPIDDIFTELDRKIAKNYQFIGFLKSKEIKNHYQSWFWCLNYKIVMKLYNIIKNRYYDNKQKIINNFEVDISNKFINNFKSDCLYNFDISKNMFYHHPDIYQEKLDDGFPIVKCNLFSAKFREKYNFKLPPNIDAYIPKDIFTIVKAKID